MRIDVRRTALVCLCVLLASAAVGRSEEQAGPATTTATHVERALREYYLASAGTHGSTARATQVTLVIVAIASGERSLLYGTLSRPIEISRCPPWTPIINSSGRIEPAIRDMHRERLKPWLEQVGWVYYATVETVSPYAEYIGLRGLFATASSRSGLPSVSIVDTRSGKEFARLESTSWDSILEFVILVDDANTLAYAGAVRYVDKAPQPIRALGRDGRWRERADIRARAAAPNPTGTRVALVMPGPDARPRASVRTADLEREIWTHSMGEDATLKDVSIVWSTDSELVCFFTSCTGAAKSASQWLVYAAGAGNVLVRHRLGAGDDPPPFSTCVRLPTGPGEIGSVFGVENVRPAATR